jgi:hypothetical protein
MTNAIRLRALLAAALLVLPLSAARVQGAEAPHRPPPPDHVLFFVDYSGSMNLLHPTAGESRIRMAKKLLKQLIRELPPDYSRVSIHAFSPDETILEDQPLDREQALRAVDAIRTDFPVRGRRTRLAPSLERLSEVLESLDGTVSVVVLTDGGDGLGDEARQRFRDIRERFGERAVFHFVSYAGRESGRRMIKELRAVDGRGEYAYGDTLLEQGRQYDRLLRRALHAFPFGGAAAAKAPGGFGPATMGPPVPPGFAHPGAEEPRPPAPKPKPATDLDLVIELADPLLKAGMAADPHMEQMIVLRPAAKRPGSGLGRELAPGMVYVLAMLSQNPDLRLSIETHTDSLGDEQENMAVTRRWGELARRWLAERGIDESRLRVEAYGELRPLYDNASPWGRRLNRRIRFRALREGQP